MDTPSRPPEKRFSSENDIPIQYPDLSNLLQTRGARSAPDLLSPVESTSCTSDQFDSPDPELAPKRANGGTKRPSEGSPVSGLRQPSGTKRATRGRRVSGSRRATGGRRASAESENSIISPPPTTPQPILNLETTPIISALPSPCLSDGNLSIESQDAKKHPQNICDNLLKNLKKAVSKKTKGSFTHVYIMKVQDESHIANGHLKIGIADNPNRKEKILAECKFKDLSSRRISNSLPPSLAIRAEGLIQCELKAFQSIFECRCVANRKHREYFNVDQRIAEMTIKKWVWVMRCGFYDEVTGEFDPYLGEEIQRIMIQNPLTEEHSDHFLRHEWWMNLIDRLIKVKRQRARESMWKKAGQNLRLFSILLAAILIQLSSGLLRCLTLINLLLVAVLPPRDPHELMWIWIKLEDYLSNLGLYGSGVLYSRVELNISAQ